LKHIAQSAYKADGDAFLRALDYRFKQIGVLNFQNELSDALKSVSPW